MAPTIRKKFVMVGDSLCGKTSLLSGVSKVTFPEVRGLPSEKKWQCHTYLADVEVNGRQVDLELQDTAGHEDYDRLRHALYPNTDAFLLSFAIDSPESLKNIEEKWKPEVYHFCPNVPVILVGTKKDLRIDSAGMGDPAEVKPALVTPEEGQAMASKIYAFAYVECSVVSKEGIAELFDKATRAAFQVKEQKQVICNIL